MPRGRKPAQDRTTLEMALIGYEVERKRLSDKIGEIQSLLGRGKRAGGGPVAKKQAAAQGAPKRVLSAAARARIAAAQRKRWAEHNKQVAAAARA